MALSKCVPEIEAMAKNLIAIFGANSDETRFIKALTAYEISKTGTPSSVTLVSSECGLEGSQWWSVK